MIQFAIGPVRDFLIQVHANGRDGQMDKVSA